MRKSIRQKIDIKFLLVTLSLGAFTLLYLVLSYTGNISDEKLTKMDIESLYIKRELIKSVNLYKNKLPTKISTKDSKYEIEYTLNAQLEKFILKKLKYYGTHESAVVVIDNNNSNILALVGYDKSTKKMKREIALSATNPAASVFKIITASMLFNKHKIKPETIVSYHGRGTTLYKSQLKDKTSRWERKITFKKAFAYSNNVVFGKAAIKNLSSHDLYQGAQKFGFNQELSDEFPVMRSTFIQPRDQYNLAEMASGFNRITTLSPLHAAMIASVVANNGVFQKSKIYKKITKVEGNEVVNVFFNDKKKILKSDTINDLERSMIEVIKRGTARGSFRNLNKKLKKALVIGGKTGRISGGIPHARRDWFISFARPKGDSFNTGISVAVMNINFGKWFVRPALVAKDIIQYYYQKIDPSSIKSRQLVLSK